VTKKKGQNIIIPLKAFRIIRYWTS